MFKMTRRLPMLLFVILSACSMTAAQDGNKEAKPTGGAKASISIVESIYDYKIVNGKPLKIYADGQPGDAVRPALIALHLG